MTIFLVLTMLIHEYLKIVFTKCVALHGFSWYNLFHLVHFRIMHM